MWPFSRREKFQTPTWFYQTVIDKHTTLSLSPGRWVVTDGAHFTKDSVEVERITICDGFLDLKDTDDGIELLTIGYKAKIPEARRDDKVLVIDSGDMIFCCEDAFVRGGVTLKDRRICYAFFRIYYAYWKAEKMAGRDSSTMLVHDATQDCIGVIACPRWGDGAYRLEFDSSGEFQLLRAHLGESC
ncbi:MAG: hypothetical protein JXB10_04250 [Pirellulales bacterium]|nr:hypothetical protein [Pirellulales bacterium]